MEEPMRSAISSASLASVSRHAEFSHQQYFGSLNGLRALSVLAVIWHHTGGEMAGLWPILGLGQHGVTLFFAISGTLITTLLLRERERSGQIDLKAFFIRRSLRIFPLYYAVIGLYVVLVFALERDKPEGHDFFNNLPFFLTYTSNWFVPLEGRVIFYFAWSLAAEEQFYLVWPSVQKFFAPKLALLVACALCTMVIAARLLSGGEGFMKESLTLRVLGQIPLAICLGVVLAHALHDKRSFYAMRWLFASRASALIWMSIFIAVLSWQASRLFLVDVLAVMLVGSCVYREDHFLAPLLQLPALRYVGQVSYGVYLLHMLVKNVVVKVLTLFALELTAYSVFFITALASVLVAGLSFRYFESSFLALRHRSPAT
jgi:peptidoglycan/LPS O-acetylase OafA/YrhL